MTRARRLRGVIFGVLLLVGAGLGFYQIWLGRLEDALARERLALEGVAANVDSLAHGARTGLRMLRTEAERELRRGDARPAAVVWPALAEVEGGFVSLAPPAGLPARQAAFLFGRGAPPPSGNAERTGEMAAALALTPLMADVRDSVMAAAWVYYTSAQGFTLLHPFADPGMSRRLRWRDDFLRHPLFSGSGPDKNPGRRARWQAAYFDQAGLGPMTSLVAPVYDEHDRLRAIVALDFTLSRLERYLTRERFAGDLLIVNDAAQVLAASEAMSAPRIASLAEVLPPELGARAARLQAETAGRCVTEGRWRVCGANLEEAPWRVLGVVDTYRLGWHTLGSMWVEVVGLLLLVLLLLTVERRRRLVEILREGGARYRRIVEGSDQGFWDWNIPARKFSASPRFDALLGYAEGESPLRRHDGLAHVHPDDWAGLVASIRRHLRGKAPSHRVEFRARAQNGSWRWLLTQGRVVERDARGRAVMMSGTLTDVTERRQAEEDLLAAKQAAEAANVAKSRFLAAASHDLRQPLQASNLFVSALKRTPLNEEQQKIAHNLGLATQALGELLDALLDISKLDAGVVTPHLAPVEIYEIFQRIDSEFASLALEKGLRFKLSFPSQPLVFETDFGLLMGLLRNLIGNAIRYTEWGGVLIGTRLRPGRLLIQVWDTGIGIREDQLPRIYEEFYQVDNPQRDRGRGLGLGLSIVRRMADLLGYGLVCKSRYGRGTLFEVRIPLGEAAAAGSAAALENRLPADAGFADVGRLQGCLCVLVEDDPLVASALNTWLGSHGIRLRHFADADQALADPDIGAADFVVTDFRMPGRLNGIQFLDALRRRLGRPLRAVIVTGDTSREQIDAFASAGWPVLHKPIDPERLLALLLDLLRTPAA